MRGNVRHARNRTLSGLFPVKPGTELFSGAGFPHCEKLSLLSHSVRWSRRKFRGEENHFLVFQEAGEVTALWPDPECEPGRSGGVWEHRAAERDLWGSNTVLKRKCFFPGTKDGQSVQSGPVPQQIPPESMTKNDFSLDLQTTPAGFAPVQCISFRIRMPFPDPYRAAGRCLWNTCGECMQKIPGRITENCSQPDTFVIY